MRAPELDHLLEIGKDPRRSAYSMREKPSPVPLLIL